MDFVYVIKLMVFIWGNDPGLFRRAHEYYDRDRKVKVKESV